MYHISTQRRLVALTAACALVLAVASGASGADAKLKPYTNAMGGYSVSLPSGWAITEPPGTPVVVATDSAGAAAGLASNINVGCESVPPGTTADAYMKAAKEMIARGMPGIKEIDTSELELAGGKGYAHHYSFAMGGKSIEGISYIVVKDDKAYVITCMAELANFAREKATFEAVAASLTLGAGGGGEAGESAAGEPVPLEADALENPQDYADAERGFSLQFPEDWEITQPKKGAAVSAASPRENPRDFFREYVTVATRKLTGEATAESFRDDSMKRSRKTAPNLMPGEMGTTTINGLDAAWVTYTLTAPLAATRGVMYFVLSEDRAAVINCAAEAGTFDQYKPTFDSIAATFRFDTPSEGGEAGAAEEPPAPPANLYADDTHGFSILFPEGWAVTSRGTAAAATAIRPREGEVDPFSEAISVRVTPAAKPVTAKEYEARYFSELKMRTPTFALVESGDMKLDGSDVRYTSYTARMGTIVFKNVAYIFAKGLRVYVVTGQSTEASFERYMPVFEDAAKSLKIAEPPESEPAGKPAN